MSKTRVIIETQTNSLFRGSEGEQNYDQRGGLCQVGAGHVVVTTNEIDTKFLEYWRGLGFSLPRLITAGPFDPQCTLTELIARSPEVQRQILKAVNGSSARLELFWVDPGDAVLPHLLGIPVYGNIDLSVNCANKCAFKVLCEEIGLLTAPWVCAHSVEEVLTAYQSAPFALRPVLVKAANSTGGVSLGAIKHYVSAASLETSVDELRALEFPLVIEEMLDVNQEVTIHWELDETGSARIIGIFDQLTNNYSYSGAVLPTKLSSEIQERIRRDLSDKLIPWLQLRKGKGFFCCDILVDVLGQAWWTDFNPRKGAILYVYDMVRRLGESRGVAYHAWHEHLSIPHGSSFSGVQDVINSLLQPSTRFPFVVVTNPGLIPYGKLDLTGLSSVSREEASCVMQIAKQSIRSVFG